MNYKIMQEELAQKLEVTLRVRSFSLVKKFYFMRIII